MFGFYYNMIAITTIINALYGTHLYLSKKEKNIDTILISGFCGFIYGVVWPITIPLDILYIVKQYIHKKNK